MPRLGVGWLVGSLGLGRIVGQSWDAFWDTPRILLKGSLQVPRGGGVLCPYILEYYDSGIHSVRDAQHFRSGASSPPPHVRLLHNDRTASAQGEGFD